MPHDGEIWGSDNSDNDLTSETHRKYLVEAIDIPLNNKQAIIEISDLRLSTISLVACIQHGYKRMKSEGPTSSSL